MVEDKEKYRDLAEKILARMPAGAISSPDEMKIWFIKNILRKNILSLRGDEQWIIYDEMVYQVFPLRIPAKRFIGKNIIFKAGVPHISKAVCVPKEFYKNIVISHGKNRGQGVKQAKCEIIIAGKTYRKGMFIPVER